jgi:3-deoxy-D-manno-octulosonic-acid transferase
MTQRYKSHWHHTIWRWLYNLLLLTLLPLALLKLILKREKTEGQANKNRERFGFIGKPQKNGILIHCVSMGEVNAAKQLVEQLESQYPNKTITISQPVQNRLGPFLRTAFSMFIWPLIFLFLCRSFSKS